MPASAIAMVIVVALLHALWNIVAKNSGGAGARDLDAVRRADRRPAAGRGAR